MGDEAARGGDDPPPGQPFDPAQDIANGAGGAGEASFGRNIAIAQHITGPSAVQNSNDGVFELAQPPAMRSAHHWSRRA